jgi:O-antigen ligase
MVFSYSKTIIFFFLLLYCIRAISEFRQLTWAFVGAIASLELAALLAKVQGRVRITSTYDPNDLAFVMVCALPIAVALFPIARGLLRFALPAVVVLALMTIIMTQSRGGFVSLLVVGPLLLVKIPSRNPFLKVGIVVAGVLVFALFAPTSYWDRISTIWGSEDRPKLSDQYLEGGLATARLEVWKTGFRFMLENPIAGVGIGSFQFAEGMTHKGGPWFAPHNSFLQMGAELGVAGLALFLFILYRAVRNCREVIRIARRDRRLTYHLSMAHGIEIAVYGYAVGAVALTQAYSDILYLLVGMSVLLKWLTPKPGNHPKSALSPSPSPASSRPWWRAPR